MDDSSGDDQPIGARQIVKAATKLLLENHDSDDSGSPMPEWLSQHTPQEKSKPESESSSDSDDVVDLVSPSGKEKGPDAQAKASRQKLSPLKDGAKGAKQVGKWLNLPKT